MSKDRSPNIVSDPRRSPRSPAAQKKRPARFAELESQLGHLQEELKKVKDEKIKAQQEADKAKRHVLALSEKLEELSEFEEARFQELRKVSRDRDRAWVYELDARQKLHHMDSLALSSAINQVQKLKIQLAESEASQREAELEEELKSARAEVEELKATLIYKESQLKNISEQNFLEERSKLNSEAEKEALTEEADKSSRKAIGATEQLADMEGQLRRLKVQADQWRKAAEAAAGMLNFSEVSDDDSSSPKKKNGNMLKKIGVLLKKGQK